ncbi:sigma factor-like helix-turn-helix DNA-binding protein [Streptomyces sp. C10]|uniref:sigma factor-like helix-turn-helix DNA-binding protein n=1 Tax=Streptomyces sp. C10 TaxID=531941 RepID=UPI003980FFF6
MDRPVQASGSKQQTGFVAEEPALALAEDIQALKPHLAELGDRDRTLFELRFGAEMTQNEIGKDLGLSQRLAPRRSCSWFMVERPSMFFFLASS